MHKALTTSSLKLGHTWSRFLVLILVGVPGVQVEQVADPVLPVAEIVRRCPAAQLMALYRVPAFADADEFLRHVAAARGKLRKGGTTDNAVRIPSLKPLIPKNCMPDAVAASRYRGSSGGSASGISCERKGSANVCSQRCARRAHRWKPWIVTCCIASAGLSADRMQGPSQQHATKMGGLRPCCAGGGAHRAAGLERRAHTLLHAPAQAR